MRSAWWLVALVAACGGEPRDGAAPDTTEPDVITAEDSLEEPPADPVFQLAGTEPLWGVRIDSAGLRFTTPEDPGGRIFAATRAVMHADTLRWNSLDSSGTSIEVIVVAAPCSDGMSDKAWAYTSRVVIATRSLSGCAERVHSGR